MVCDIAFLHKSNEPTWSGKRRSTEALIYGLQQIGVKAIYTDNLKIKAIYYAVDCIDDLTLLPNVDKARQIAWIRRDVTQPPTPRFDFDPPGNLFASSQSVANLWPNYQVHVLPDAVVLPKLGTFFNIKRWQINQVLYVGRVCRSKGIPLLLKAMAFLDENWHLDIVGFPFADFTALVKSLRLQSSNLSRQERYEALAGIGHPHNQAGPKASVTFHGEQPYWRVQRFYAGADVVVVPAQNEPFGRAVIEALAYNKPAVAIKGSGGPEEILPEDYLSNHNPLHLAEAIRGAHFNSSLKIIAKRYEPKVVANQFINYLQTK